jgi:hypothetical protein
VIAYQLENIMAEKKMGPTEMQAEVARLHAAGKLPQLHEVLGAVADTRKKYAPKILDARHKGEDDASNS